MGGQKGRDVLVRIGDGAPEGGAEIFVAVAGMRARTIRLSSGIVDATSADSPQAWRELLAGAGTKSAEVTGNGVFRDAASDARMRAVFFNQDAANFELVIPDFGVMRGPFILSDLSYAGEFDGEATFSVRLRSAGELEFEEL